MKIKNNQDGVAHVAAILVVVVIIAIGVVGWKVWDNNKSSKTTSTSESPKATSAKKKSETTKETTPAFKEYLEIKELGVKIPLADETRDGYYELGDNGATLRVDLPGDTNKTCSTQAVLSKVSNYSEDAENWRERPSELEKVGVKIGDSYYFMEGGQSACTEDQSLQDKATAIRAAWLKQNKLIEQMQ